MNLIETEVVVPPHPHADSAGRVDQPIGVDQALGKPAADGYHVAEAPAVNRIADAILHFAKEARSMLGGKKEIGVFFGYYMLSDSKLVSFGHLDYERVFASPNIDFVIGPGTYSDRMIGGGTGPQLVHGTALRYGKRYLHEIDHRTHYVAKTWKTQEEDEAGLKREAAFALVNHASHWWFDMWGGWYQNKETRQLIGPLQKLWEAYGNDRAPSVAQTLLVADPKAPIT